MQNFLEISTQHHQLKLLKIDKINDIKELKVINSLILYEMNLIKIKKILFRKV